MIRDYCVPNIYYFARSIIIFLIGFVLGYLIHKFTLDKVKEKTKGGKNEKNCRI